LRHALIDKGKLIAEGGKLTNGRCAKELAKAHRRIDEARKNGALGGRPPHRSPEDRPKIDRTSAGSPGEVPRTSRRSAGDVPPISEPALLNTNDLAKPDGFAHRKPNHQPPTTNHQREREDAASPLPPAKVAEAKGEPNHIDSEKAAATDFVLSEGKAAKSPSKANGDARKVAAPRPNHLAALIAFQPTPEQIAELQFKFPRSFARWQFELGAAKENGTVRAAFEKGERDDPWPTFREWMRREERHEIRHPTTSAGKHADKLRAALQAGTPEARKAYDPD
jgi:hypothetical protein